MNTNWNSRNTVIGAISFVFIAAAAPTTTIKQFHVQPYTEQIVTFVSPVSQTSSLNLHSVLPDFKLNFTYITSVSVSDKVQFGKKFYGKKLKKKHLDKKLFSLREDEEELLIILEIIKRLI